MSAIQAANNAVVLFHYRLSEQDGEQLEDSRSENPVASLLGHDNIIAGLETALLGKSAGDIFSVTVAPGQAYGEYRANAKQRVPIKHLLTKGKLRPSMVVSVQTEQGVRQMVVDKVGRFNVDVDTNHPLAGKTLIFDIEIIEVRAATTEEISHGHAHGDGGHQH